MFSLLLFLFIKSSFNKPESQTELLYLNYFLIFVWKVRELNRSWTQCQSQETFLFLPFDSWIQPSKVSLYLTKNIDLFFVVFNRDTKV